MQKLRKYLIGILLVVTIVLSQLNTFSIQAATNNTPTSSTKVNGRKITIFQPFAIGDSKGKNAHTYALCKSSSAITWDECANICTNIGGYLITIDNNTEAKGLFKNLRKIQSGRNLLTSGTSGLGAYIGHRFNYSRGQIIGTDGTKFSVTENSITKKYKMIFDTTKSFTKGLYNKKNKFFLTVKSTGTPNAKTINSSDTHKYFICEWSYSISSKDSSLTFSQLNKQKTLNCTVVGTGNISKRRLSYKTSNKRIATVSRDGKVTSTGWGKCFITVTGNNDKFPVSNSIPIYVRPAAPLVTPDTTYNGSKNSSKCTISFSFANVSGATHYVVKQFNEKGTMISEITFKKSGKKNIKNLKSGKKVTLSVVVNQTSKKQTLYYSVTPYHNDVIGKSSDAVSISIKSK